MRNINEVRKNSFEERSSDLYRVGYEQLFSELTSAEASLIEGGRPAEVAVIEEGWQYQLHFVDTSVNTLLCVYVEDTLIWQGQSNEKKEGGLKPIGSGAFSAINSQITVSAGIGCSEEKGGKVLAKIAISGVTLGSRVDSFNYKPGSNDPLSGAYTVVGFVNA